LPIALSFALGPIYGSALGSGITTLLQGGSLKDAAKSALISGAIGGVTAGFSGPGKFMDNVKFAAGNPLQAGAYQTDKLFDTKGGIGGLTYDNPYGFNPNASATQVAQAGTADKAVDNAFMTEGTDPVVARKAQLVDTKEIINKPPPEPKSFMEKYLYDPKPNVALPDGASNVTNPASGEGYLESIFSPSRSSITQGGQALEAGAAEVAKQNQILAGAGKEALSEKAANELLMSTAKAAKTTAPTFLTKAAPSLYAAGAVGTGVALAGAFKDDDGDGVDDSTGLTLDEYKTQYPDRFFDDRFYGDNPYYQDPTFYTAPAMYAAGGGAINGPGTSTSDSIPAMLSDGEFVMNAKAVRGAGDGDRRAGAQRMYDMMRSLERRG